MRAILPVAAMTTCLAIAACGPSYQGSYPSYEAVISKYAPQGTYTGVKLDDPAYYPAGHYCDCPRIWYDGHWVYYYHGRWIYWYHSCWYYYPVFYVYYWGGVPYVYVGPTKSIQKVSPSSAGGAPAVHHATPPARPHDSKSFEASPPSRSKSSPSRDRDSSSPGKRRGGR